MKTFLTYKEFKSLFKTFFNLYLFILGITWIPIQIYLRFFLNRSSYTLVEIKPYLTSTHYLVFISFILFHISLICIISIQLYKIVYKKKSHPIVIILTEK